MNSKKTVYFLLSCFVVYCVADIEVTRHRLPTEYKFYLTCPLSSITDVELVHWMFEKYSQGNKVSSEKVILTYDIAKNVTYIDEEFANVFNTKVMKLREGKIDLLFRSTKTWHEGLYYCKTNRTGFQPIIRKRTYLRFFENQMKIVPCKEPSNILLWCKIFDLDEEPGDVRFDFKPQNQNWSPISAKIPVYTKISKGSQYYNITAQTVVHLKDIGDLPKSIKCVVRSKKSNKQLITSKIVTLRKHDISKNNTDACFPNVEVEQRLQWLKVGTESVLMLCKFNLPLYDEIKSVRWFHHKMSQSLNKSEIIKPSSDDEIMQSSFIVEGRNSTLKLDKAKIEHSGNYTCQVNYHNAGNSSDSGELVVYQINKPYYFNATVDRDIGVLLECKVGDLFPSPEEIVFSKYDRVTELISKLDKKPSTQIITMKNGLFNISAKMSIEVDESENVEYICDIVLSKHLNITESTFEPKFSNISTESTFEPKFSDISTESTFEPEFSDISTSDISSKRKTTIIIATGVAGLLVFVVGLVYALKRFWSPCLRNVGSSKEDESKTDE